MRRHLFTMLMAAMVLYAPLVSSSIAMSNGSSPQSKLIIESSLPFPDDTAIQLPDPTFEAVVRDIIGKPNGDITVDDVAKIIELNLYWLGIDDLTGIEYFTSLEVLNCGENLLTELDISQNTKLKKLVCNMNYLSTLDTSHNPVLEYLSCWGNQLLTLDVSHNPALEYFTCDTNQLTSLDVSHNPVLAELRCGANQLTKLNLSHNPALTWLSCDTNQLTMLDVSRNTELKNLNCGGNQLTTLDVSHNVALVWFNGHNNRFADETSIKGLNKSNLELFVFDPQDGISH